MMALFIEELVDELVSTIEHRNPITGFFDEDVTETSLDDIDPVARITQDTAEAASGLPSALARPDPLDEAIDLDRMTNTYKEFRQARETYQQQTPGSSGSFASAQAATMPQVTTTDRFVKKLLAKKGMSYEWGYEGQRDPVTGEWAADCSGLIIAVMQDLGFDFPRTNSAGIYDRSKKISLKKAINTRGAILYREGHIAISLGNGKTIEAMGEAYGVVVGDAHGRFTAGGLLPELKTSIDGKGGKRKKPNKPQLKIVSKQAKPESPNLSSVTNPTAVFGGLMDQLDVPMIKMREARGRAPTGPSKGVLGQLYAGFMDAGREDLAKMVFTKDFKKWLGQESGMRPHVVSPANNQGMPNGGLFQIWQGHDWAKRFFKNGKFTPSAYEQAKLVASHFDLTADDIRRYANAIDNGTYVGWG